MNKKSLFCCYGFASLIVLLCALTTGCSKKSAAPTATAPVTTETSPTPADASPSAANPSSANDQIAEANAALQAKDYEKAAAALTITPQSPGPQTSDQIIAFNRTKGALESQVTAAAAAGDPQAKAALEKMRQDALYHH